MVAKKKPEGTEVAVPPVDGELLVNMNVGTAVGRIITAGQAGMPEIERSYNNLFDGRTTGEMLAAFAGTLEGNAALKAHIKLCTGMRSALDRAHKDAKAPFWDACKALDAKLKEQKAQVELMEAPAKQALADYDKKQEKLAADAQAARMAELEAENAKLRQHLEKQDVIPPFEDRKVSLLVRGREAAQAARALFGDSYDEVKTDERGVNYVLEVTLQRKEIQDV